MTKTKPEVTKTPCPMCGLPSTKRERSGKLRYRHKCPHGKWCAQGDALWGSHSNGRPPPSQACCRDNYRARAEKTA